MDTARPDASSNLGAETETAAEEFCTDDELSYPEVKIEYLDPMYDDAVYQNEDPAEIEDCFLQESDVQATSPVTGIFKKIKIIQVSKTPLKKAPAKHYKSIKSETTDGKVMRHTIGTNVKLKSNLKIPRAPTREDNKKIILENLTSTSEVKPFACKVCKFSSNYKYKLKEHTLSHARDQSPGPKDKSNHTVLEKDAASQTRRKLLSCNKCSYMCVDECKLKQHRLIHGRKKPVAFVVSKKNLKFVLGKSCISDIPKVTFSCQECDEKFDDETALKQHVFTHARGKLISCNECSYMCIDEEKLKTHFLSHNRATEKQNVTNASYSVEADSNYSTLKLTNESGEMFTAFKCKDCNKVFNHRAVFKRHLLNHVGKKRFSCSYCSFSSTQIAHLSSHIMSTHVGEDPYSCAKCGKTFSDAKLAAEHARVHLKHRLSRAGDDTFSCKECNLKFKECSELERHMISHNDSSLCSDCGKTFSSKTALKLHALIHVESKPFFCNECSKTFSTERCLNQHQLQHAVGAKLFPCDRCGKSFKEGTYLNKHILTHTREKKFLCNICTYMCTTKHTLKKHLRTHTGEKPFSCDECSFKTADKFSLKKHALTHSEDKPFSCHLCSYMCITNARLKVHLISHTGEKPFSCSVCGKMFTTNRSLTIHTRIHTHADIRGKRYLCNVCKYSCSSNAGLLRHKRCHTGEKPYSCEICDFKCAVKYTLRTHILTHTGEKPFPCHLCSHMSTTSSSLKRHLLTHSGEKAFSCDVCSYRGSTRSSLNRHVRIHLGEKPYSKKKRWIKKVSKN